MLCRDLRARADPLVVASYRLDCSPAAGCERVGSSSSTWPDCRGVGRKQDA